MLGRKIKFETSKHKSFMALLEGIRVIDFGRFIAAPYSAMLLADFGADVIRVERREGGEDRRLGPITESGEGGLYLNLNRNKRAITLDLSHELSTAVVRRLVESADVVIVNLPIDLMRRLGLDYETLKAIKEEIILVMASAFGPDGPYSDRVGFDGVAQAMSGAMSLTGPEGEPVRSVVSWADYGTALHAAFGVMAALYHRQKTGRGQLIDVSLLATSVMFMLPFLAERQMTGIVRRQQGNTSYYTAPSDTYRTRTGWIIVPTIGDQMFRRWARLVGREDLIDDPRFRDDMSRAGNSVVINRVMSEWCAARTRDEAIAELEAARVPCGAVYELDEVISDPQVKSRGLIQSIGSPGASKAVPVAPAPVRMSETVCELRRRAPALSEHTNEVLAELGFNAGEIDALRKQGVI
jgi:crotonobetainyl-CoA:carnitine CoA-transferase CaiB-like acyl-CoA transferase